MFYYPTATGQQPMMFAAPMSTSAANTGTAPAMMPFPGGVVPCSGPSATETTAAANTSNESNNTNGNNANTSSDNKTNSANPNNSMSSVLPPQATCAGAIPMAMPVPMTALSPGAFPFAMTLSPPGATATPNTMGGTCGSPAPGVSGTMGSVGSAVSPTGPIMVPVVPAVPSPSSSAVLSAPGASVPTAAGAASPPSYEAVVLDPNGPRSQTNLFVRKLASAVTEKDVQSLFEPFGKILSFGLMRNIHTGEPLGTAFVRFAEHEQAKAAMEALEGKELYGRSISIQWAKKHHDGTPVGEARKKIHKVFVRNVPLDISGKELRNIFAPHGTISNVTVHADTAPMTNPDGTSAPSQRNIAFIVFHDDGAAENAVKALHNTCPFPSCNSIPLMVKLAEDNRQRLERKGKLGENTASSNPAILLPTNPSDSALPDLSQVMRTPETGVLATGGSSTGSPAVPHLGSATGPNSLSPSPGTSIPPGAIPVPGGLMFPVTMQPSPQPQPSQSQTQSGNAAQPQMQPVFFPYMAAGPGGAPMMACPQYYMPQPVAQSQQQPYYMTMDANGMPMAAPMFYAPVPMAAAPGVPGQPQAMYFAPAQPGQPTMMMPMAAMPQQQPSSTSTANEANNSNSSSAQKRKAGKGRDSASNTPHTGSLSGTPPQHALQEFTVVASNVSPVNADLTATKTAPTTVTSASPCMMGMPVLMTASSAPGGAHPAPNAFSTAPPIHSSSGNQNNTHNTHSTSGNPAAGAGGNAGKSNSSLMPPRMSSMPDLTTAQQKGLGAHAANSSQQKAAAASAMLGSIGNTFQAAAQNSAAAGPTASATALRSRNNVDVEEDDEDVLFGNMGANLEADEDSDDDTAARRPRANQNNTNYQHESSTGEETDVVAYTQELMERFRMRASTNSSEGVSHSAN